MRALAVIFLLWTLWPAVAAGETTCLDAAAKAETRYDIPDKLLQAITLVETGRGAGEEFVAWPWTTNINATGQYFDSKSEALRFVREAMRDGETSIDVGCFQINTKWHGEQFASIDEMVDPEAGANYAAKFLLDLKNEFGDWDTAASKYHSRTPIFSTRYSRKLTAVQHSLLETEGERTVANELFLRTASLSSGENSMGGVTLSIFANAKPLIERRPARSLFESPGSP